MNDNIILEYNYDLYNEIISVKDYLSNKSINYIYDTFGNITNEIVKDLNNNILENNNYTYDNIIKDRLISYNDINITYDEIGNPLTIGNNTLSWINGRQLKSFNDIEYKYNLSGYRTSKKINNMETIYYLEGSNIIFEINNDDMLYYIYNSLGELVGFKYNNTLYYYLKNNSNDIIGILDSNSNLIAKYRYDIWGNILSVTDKYGNDIIDSNHIAHINPYRYRSYYYDKETDLYYLNSRYYSPKLHRFINADGIIGANQDILSYNLYAYCSNDPVNNTDSSGYEVLSLNTKGKKYMCLPGNSNSYLHLGYGLNLVTPTKTNVSKVPKNDVLTFEKKKAVCQPRNYCKMSDKPKSKSTYVAESGAGVGLSTGKVIGGSIFLDKTFIKDKNGSQCYMTLQSSASYAYKVLGISSRLDIPIDCSTNIIIGNPKSSYTATILFVDISDDGTASILIGYDVDSHNGLGSHHSLGYRHYLKE